MSDREDCTQHDLVIDGIEVATWYSEGMEAPYMAVNMTHSKKFLEGYNLTEKEKTELPALTAGYCRLLEEYGLTGYGDTELESITDLFSNAIKT